LTNADYSFINAATNLHETLAIVGLLSLKGQLCKQLLQVYVTVAIAVQLGKSCVHPTLPIPVLLQLQHNSAKVKVSTGREESKEKKRLCLSGVKYTGLACDRQMITTPPWPDVQRTRHVGKKQHQLFIPMHL